MKRVFDFIKSRHQDIFRIFVILLAIFLITTQYPKHGVFKYDFSIDKPWAYEDINAPASFPIKKSIEEIEKEKKDIAAGLIPFFQVVGSVPQTVKDHFEKHIRSETTSADSTGFSAADSAQMLKKGFDIIDRIYDKGLIDPQGLAKIEVADRINVTFKNEVKEVPVADLYQMKDALTAVDDLVGKSGLKPELQQKTGSAIKQNLIPNIVFDSLTTNNFLADAINTISLYRGAVQEDENIIRYGEIVTPEKFQKLESLKEYTEGQMGERNRLLIELGYFILTALCLSIFGAFMFNFSPDVFRSMRKLLFILLMIVGFIFIVGWAVEAQIQSYYVIPFCIVPIILRNFFGIRLSLYTHLIIVLMASFIVPMGIEYTVLNLVAGMVAIFTNTKVHYWSQFFISIGFILITYSIGFFGISLIQEGQIGSLEWIDFGWLAINAFLTLMAYPLIPIFEKLFGTISEITLIELGDLNKPLLKDLQTKAPGTFQHSLQVANLAEAAAIELGANSLLVKVGCLYHDIGKTANPVYFIENQNTRYNPHDELPFAESAKVIIEHVTKGVEMAKKHKLPDVIIDFIRTHHGTSRVEYFYRSYIKSFPDAEIDDSIFRYPGPLPFSMETAIVMICDTVEAASRSLKEPTAEAIDNLVEALVKNKIDENQLVNATISFRDITRLKKLLKQKLHSIYHVRIEYPKA
jgi:cyclic-di-AMP phosphodiesterase PgpH